MNYWAQKKIFNIPLPDRLDLTLLLRGILAIMVVWWHTNGYRITDTPLAFLNIPGRICVWFFFILSGYTIGYAFEKNRYRLDTKGILHFYKNRLIRIYPLLLFITLLAALINLYFNKNPISWTTSFFLKEFLMLQWNHSYQLVGVFWALGVEIQFYLLAPLLAFWLQKTRKSSFMSLLTFVFFLFIPILAKFIFHSSWDNRSLSGNLSHFYAGFILNYLRDKASPSKLDRISPTFLCLISLVILYSTSWMYQKKPGLFWASGPLLVDLTGIGLLTAHVIWERKKIPLHRLAFIFSILGVFSYGIYAWHGLLVQYSAYCEAHFFVTLLATIILSILSYFLIEQPALRFRRST